MKSKQDGVLAVKPSAIALEKALDIAGTYCTNLYLYRAAKAEVYRMIGKIDSQHIELERLRKLEADARSVLARLGEEQKP